jgi:hypothetical protein
VSTIQLIPAKIETLAENEKAMNRIKTGTLFYSPFFLNLFVFFSGYSNFIGGIIGLSK